MATALVRSVGTSACPNAALPQTTTRPAEVMAAVCVSPAARATRLVASAGGVPKPRAALPQVLPRPLG